MALRTTEVEEPVKAAAGVSSYTASRGMASSGRSLPQYARQPAAAPAHHSLGVPAEPPQIPLPQVSSSSVPQPVATPTWVARQTASRSCAEANRGRWAKVSDLPQAPRDEVAAQADITTAAAERVERKLGVTAPIYSQRNSSLTSPFRTRARSVEPGDERVAENRSPSVDFKPMASGFEQHQRGCALLPGAVQPGVNKAYWDGFWNSYTDNITSSLQDERGRQAERPLASPRGRGAGRLAWACAPFMDEEGGEALAGSSSTLPPTDREMLQHRWQLPLAGGGQDGHSARGGAAAPVLPLRAGPPLRPAAARSLSGRRLGEGVSRPSSAEKARSGQPLLVGGASRLQQQRCSATPPVPPTALGDGGGAVAGKSDGGGGAAAETRTRLRPSVSITTRPD